MRKLEFVNGVWDLYPAPLVYMKQAQPLSDEELKQFLRTVVEVKGHEFIYDALGYKSQDMDSGKDCVYLVPKRGGNA